MRNGLSLSAAIILTIVCFTNCKQESGGHLTKSQLDSAINYKKDSFARVYRNQLDSIILKEAIDYVDSIKQQSNTQNSSKHNIPFRPRPNVSPQTDTSLLEDI